jgi:hypothetical protein
LPPAWKAWIAQHRGKKLGHGRKHGRCAREEPRPGTRKEIRMDSPSFSDNKIPTVLHQVREGMRVCDRNGEDIGQVRRLYLGAVSEAANEQGRGPATAPGRGGRDDSLIENLAETFTADEPLPEALRGRLLRQGYIRIDTAGLFSSDRFALPEQIDSVSDD